MRLLTGHLYTLFPEVLVQFLEGGGQKSTFHSTKSSQEANGGGRIVEAPVAAYSGAGLYLVL